MKRNLFQTTLFSMLAASAIGISAPVFAGDNLPEDVARFITICDDDKDGMVSKAELMRRAETEFTKLDKSKKGMVNTSQFTQNLVGQQKSNGNGPGTMASKAEIMRKLDMAFDAADVGKKGMLERARVDAFLAEWAKNGA